MENHQTKDLMELITHHQPTPMLSEENSLNSVNHPVPVQPQVVRSIARSVTVPANNTATTLSPVAVTNSNS